MGHRDLARRRALVAGGIAHLERDRVDTAVPAAGPLHSQLNRPTIRADDDVIQGIAVAVTAGIFGLVAAHFRNCFLGNAG